MPIPVFKALIRSPLYSDPNEILPLWLFSVKVSWLENSAVAPYSFYVFKSHRTDGRLSSISTV
jgi:hypothetical protein